ncbi:MAG: hypothetical protein GX495_10305 [Chloroflexi bacterium]|nr:hypothetical protein [Chloroflexota bacterium]
MSQILNWLSKNKTRVHLLAFLLTMLPSIPLYFAARSGSVGLVWVLIGLVILGNLLAVATK